MKIFAYGKINLSLYITGITSNNMHLLDSVFATTKNIKDTIIIRRTKHDKIIFCGKHSASIDCQNNTVIKALKFFREKTKISSPLYIKVKKNIPCRAGLGGSSADAAAIINALCKSFDIDIKSPSVSEIALLTGSDIPFMLRGGVSRVKGIGDIFSDININYPLYAVICMDSEVSTAECYRQYDALNIPFSTNMSNDLLESALTNGTVDNVKNYIKNDLEAAAVFINPLILSTRDNMKKVSKGIVSMTGSGGAYFTICRDKKTQRKIFSSLKGKVKHLFKTII